MVTLSSVTIRGSMEHWHGLRLAALIVALTLAACGGSIPTPALTSGLPPLAVTPDATATALMTIGSRATPLLSPTGRILFSAIAPTARIAYVYVMNADGSGRANLTGPRGGGEPTWSPDGTMVAFVRNDGIWVMHADGSAVTEIRHDPTMVEEWPVWSPDGRQIAHLESPVCGLCSIGITWALNIMNSDGSGLRKLTDTPSDGRPAWSPDGQTIVVGGRSDDPPTPANGLQSIRLDGSGLHQLTNGPDSSPAWSPDGTLAFLRGATTAADGTVLYSLVEMNSDGSSPRVVPLPIVMEAPLAWSPDGGWIAMAGATSLSTLRAGQWDIWITRPDGSGLVAITNTQDQGEASPAWH
jgi:Tol biopolymer transport system component